MEAREMAFTPPGDRCRGSRPWYLLELVSVFFTSVDIIDMLICNVNIPECPSLVVVGPACMFFFREFYVADTDSLGTVVSNSRSLK